MSGAGVDCTCKTRASLLDPSRRRCGETVSYNVAPHCRDSPEAPLKNWGNPAQNLQKTKTHLLIKRTHQARPTSRWPPRPTGVAQSKAPSIRFRLARGLTPPSSRFRLARGLTPPSSRFRLARGPAPPSSGFRLARGLISASLEAPSQARLLPHAGTGI
jgi:hypothetical protein